MLDSLRLFLVEDDEDVALLITKTLERAGHHVTRCRTAADALIVLGQGGYDLILLDNLLPDMPGLELLQALARHCPDWTVRGAAAGLHLVAQPPKHVNIGRLVSRAAARSVRLYPLQEYAGSSRSHRGLVFGYARLSEVEVKEAIRRMSDALS